MAVVAGASALGLVSAMPSGPGVVDDDTIARVARTVPPGVSTFLLTSRVDADSIIEQERAAGCSALQLVDAVDPTVYPAIRAALPGIKIVQVIHVIGPESVDEAIGIAPFVDAILLDSGNPKAAIKELGGTGRLHDWTLSRRIRDTVGIPLYLAGGLGPHNAAEAMAAVRPFGLDICSGVRTDGRLDRTKLHRFAGEIAAASAAM